MGIPRRAGKVKLIAGILFSDAGAYAAAKKALAGAFGRIDFESGVFDFTHTSYYAGEMGQGLKRRFLSFERLIDPAKAYGAKIRTNLIERCRMKGGRRTVNIDPGYLDLAKLVLFSTKDYSHRIYAGKGVFAEATLFYKNKAFNPWPWTYPDYKTAEYLGVFNSIRDILKGGRRSGHESRC